MEINEGEVRITSVPEVTIGDNHLAHLVHDGRVSIIAKTILELCKKIRQQRDEIEIQRNEIERLSNNV